MAPCALCGSVVPATGTAPAWRVHASQASQDPRRARRVPVAVPVSLFLLVVFNVVWSTTTPLLGLACGVVALAVTYALWRRETVTGPR